MRPDMAKVIVERPRFKGSNKPKGYERQLRRYEEDGLPQREGIKRRWNGGSKGLNEHLGPLRRYLDKQVGRPWNKVYSEICAHIDRNSAVQDHVRDHVDQYVATLVIIINGVPCDGEGGWNYGKPLDYCHYRRWYVCPCTGLLRRLKARSLKRRYRRVEESPPPSFRVSDNLRCCLVNNAWHLVTVRPLPLPEQSRHLGRDRDILLNRPASEISAEEARNRYGSPVYAVSKRRLARRELKQYPIPAELWG